MSKKWSDFQQRSRPQPSFTSPSNSNNQLLTTQASTDLEQPNQFTLSGQLERARNFVLGRPEPEPQGRFISLFNCMSNDRSYSWAAASFLITIGLIFVCFMMLPTLVISPSSFVLSFTLAMISMIAAMAFFNGPRLYMKKLFIEKNLYASIFLILSIILALWFSLIMPSYILSIVFCICELNAILFYFCNTTAVSWQTVKWAFSACF